MSEQPPLTDADDRRLAVQTFDRNLVVTAGAGTGKTTLLVDRLVHLLLRDPDPVPITRIVALTFTNKAADEMKQRLRHRLQGYLDADPHRVATDDAQRQAQTDVQALIRHYRISWDDFATRVGDALRNLERADLGTIHSFAATILRLYPLEAGVDPQFREDDGSQFARIFDRQWELWLDGELALGSARAADWRNVLKQLSLESIKELANSMCSEAVELNREIGGQQKIAPVLRSWLETLRAGAQALSRRHPENRANELAVRAAERIVREYLETGDLGPAVLSRERTYLLTHSVDRSTRGWNSSDIEEARNLVRAARGLCRIDSRLTRLTRRLLAPFAERFRETFIHEGFVSFDGLLVRARNLLRDHLRVREELKRHYRSLLIDEFQDTDPIQYEILLYLAEQSGKHAPDWRRVQLTSGKVFVVGDPKQSIYAFRRADIEAYLEVVDKIIKAQDGIECRLTTNFRSDPAIIDVVNGVFTPLMQAQPGMQPPYIAIQPAPDRCSGTAPVDGAGRLPRVALRRIVARDEDVDAQMARRLEGESIAAWLKETVLGRIRFANAAGQAVYAQPKDIALLLRKLTDIQDYLEPLRRRGIRYVVEGERQFYAAKEIIDAVNLLRAVENPHDRLALVGVLRSPLGAATDQTLCDLHAQNLLDYRKAERLTGRNFPESLAVLYRTLARLHDDCRRLPIGAAVTHVLTAVPFALLAAASFNGEQAVANLEKLRRQAELLGHGDGTATFKETLHRLQQRVLNVQDEGESVLAEEEVDAVRIMSVHKAKGLEFPIVVLAGCHSATDGRRGRPSQALFDWASGLTGLHVGPFSDLAGLYISEKNRLRDKEEAKRVLYVAMTRAREHLILSAGPETMTPAGSVLGMLDEVLQDQIGGGDTPEVIETRPGRLHIETVEARLTAPARAPHEKTSGAARLDWRRYVEIWKRRDRDYQAALNQSAFVTPTSLKRHEQEISEAAQTSLPRTRASSPPLLAGELAHRFLESWDFAASAKALRSELSAFLKRSVPPQDQPHFTNLHGELQAILEAFLASEAYAELARANILGREVPLLMQWDGQIMEGVIDLIYEREGLLYLADYKTDRLSHKDLHQAAQPYRRQAEIYSRAAQKSLRRQVAGFNVIFLRLGAAVKIEVAPDQESRPFQMEP